MKVRMSPAPNVQQTKLAMNPTIFSIVIFSGTTGTVLLPETFAAYANSNDISEMSEMFEELTDKSDLVRVASFTRKIMSKFKYESTHPKENAPKKPKTIKYTRSGRAVRPPTKLTLWFPYIATISTYCLSLSFVQCTDLNLFYSIHIPIFFYSSVGLVGNFAGLPVCSVPSTIVHCYQNEAGHQTIQVPSMPCWGAAGPSKHSLAFMPQTGEIDR